MRLGTRLVAWVGVLVMAVGCGDSLATAPATGVVTLNGNPLPGANVLFIPEQGGPAAVGHTGPDGTFTLSINSGSGAVVGKNLVSIQAIERFRTDGKPMTDADLNAQITEGETRSPYRTRSIIPETYGNQESSGLTAEVASGGENRFTFELTGKTRN